MRHRKNLGEPNDVVFVTTTVLGYAPVMGDPQAADRFTSGLLQCHRFYGCFLHGFVVMPEHVHYVCRLSDRLNGSQFAQRLKSGLANWMLPHVGDSYEKAMSNDPDSGYRSFFKQSFHSTPLSYGEILEQKLDYIHANPVRRGICELAADYRWSSAQFYEQGCLREDLSIADCPEALRLWPPLPPPRG